MSDNPTPTAAGWYAQPNATARHPQVRYWDGSSWVGADRRANRAGTRPRDAAGLTALILLIAGFVLTILVPVGFASIFSSLSLPGIVFTAALLIVIAATPVALVVGIVGLVRAHDGKYHAPLSLVTVIISALGTLLLVIPIALAATGVWAIHI